VRRCLTLLLLVQIAWTGTISSSTLAQRVRSEPRGELAKAAIQELNRRGPEGWRWLSTLVRDVARKDVGAARGIVAVLSGDGDAKRLAELDRAWRKTLPPVVAADLAVALSPAYPDYREKLERALFETDLPRRRDLLQRLAKRDLPTEVVRRCLKDTQLADLAFSILLDRGWTPPSGELELVARTMLAKRPDVDRLCRELEKGRLWPLMDAVAGLTSKSRAAHILLLRVSGRDIARDPLLWRSWIAARRDRYEIPAADSPGRITAGILLASDFLRRDLLEDGKSTHHERYAAGATALSILALRAAGVPSDDEAIQRGLRTAIFKTEGGLVDEIYRHNYTCSIVIMALAAVDADKYRHKIQRLASILAESQLENGQWTYTLRNPYADRRVSWPPRPTGDNSNSQYSLLGLRAARRAGADVPTETWMRAMTFWLSVLTERGWSYGPTHKTGTTTSMTAAGLSSVAICLEGLLGRGAAERIAKSAAIRRGLNALGTKLLRWGFRNVDLYAYYGVERACILTGVRRFNAFDWYSAGAVRLLAGQAEDGSFRVGEPRGRGWRYGEAIDTAYGLLFLKRATTPIAGGKDRGTVRVDLPERRPRPRRRMHNQ
jgi:hypothetical protein